MSQTTAVMATLSSIDWLSEDESRYLSNLRLVRESAVRFARWLQHAKATGFAINAPFYDLCGALDCKIEAPSFDIPESAIYIARRTIPWMLRWYALLDSGFKSMQEPDPFSPLLQCLERGGRPHHHHGFLHIEHSISFNFAYGDDAWPAGFARKIPTDITATKLTEWDEEFASRMSFGTGDKPTST